MRMHEMVHVGRYGLVLRLMKLCEAQLKRSDKGMRVRYTLSLQVIARSRRCDCYQRAQEPLRFSQDHLDQQHEIVSSVLSDSVDL